MKGNNKRSLVLTRKILLYFSSFLLVTFSTISIAQIGDKLHYPAERMVDLAPLKGQTFLTVMREKIKPAIDKLAPTSAANYDTVGYKIAAPEFVIDALDVVGSKVKRGALASGKGESNIKAVAEVLFKNNEVINLYNLPGKIAAINRSVNRFDLSTYIGLVSGGGIAVKIDNNNYYYNVHYGTGFGDPKSTDGNRDPQTGRSFSASGNFGADDVSDAAYLKTLQEYVTKENAAPLYDTIIHTLANTDVSGFAKLSALGQKVANDFLAVYTAEQDRNLMEPTAAKAANPNLKSQPWDDSLLQVTLLSAFHSGQTEINVMFQGQLTAVTKKQAPGGTVRDQDQKASLVDYWQFSSNPDPKSRNRSGINVTRSEFSKLGEKITAYEIENNPALIKAVEAIIPSSVRGTKKNVFQWLSDYLINLNTPKRLSNTPALSKAIVDFLMQVKKDANAITADIKENKI